MIFGWMRFAFPAYACELCFGQYPRWTLSKITQACLQFPTRAQDIKSSCICTPFDHAPELEVRLRAAGIQEHE
jgi:hypothetical protein